MSVAQLARRGMADSSMRRAIASGWLHEIHPGVLSTVAPSLMQFEAWQAAAILAGGDRACLCAESAAWWAELLEKRPLVIHVAVIGPRKPIKGIEWHRLKLTEGERVKLRDMPITALERIPLDLAARHSEWQLKRILAELEYHHGVSAEQVTLRRGYPGSAKLRRAVEAHTPELAATRSVLEETFARRLIDDGFRLPEFNHPVGKSTVDAIYADQRIAIELDGVKGHSGERRILRDHRRDLHRRADGFVPLRYHFVQILHDWPLISAELTRLGAPREVAWAA